VDRQKMPQSAHPKRVLGVGKRQDIPLLLAQCTLLPKEFLKDGFAIFLHDAPITRAFDDSGECPM
jgi:hypothetical protein